MTAVKGSCDSCRYYRNPGCSLIDSTNTPSTACMWWCPTAPSGLAWPAWLPPSLRAELVDYEQMAMGASECGDIGLIAEGARLQRLLRGLLEALETYRACDFGRAMVAVSEQAKYLRDAMRRRP